MYTAASHSATILFYRRIVWAVLSDWDWKDTGWRFPGF
jgi:hypothetical protein